MTAKARGIIGMIIALILFCAICNAQKPSTKDSASAPITTNGQKNADGWKRYYLMATNGDVIGVYLPGKPERFAGGHLKGGADVLSVDVYLLAAKEETYAVMFIGDLPATPEQMTDEQKANIFVGCWRSIIDQSHSAIEKQVGHPVEMKRSGPEKVTVGGHEGRVEDFIVGPEAGNARILFIGKRGYMLVGLWPANTAPKRLASFTEAFEMRLQNQK
jgi:hypothetical protein